MSYVHACSFCGWRRESATVVMLSPRCDTCGCTLDAVAPDEVRAPAGEQVAQALPSLKTPLVRALTVLFAIVLLIAAARLGFARAGLNGGLVAVGVAGFLLVPFVPERI